jgi:hypothetical protein
MQGGVGTRKKLGELLTDTSAYPNVLPEIKKGILDNALVSITLSEKGAWAPFRNTAKAVVQTVNILGTPTAVVAAAVLTTLAAIPVIGLPIAILSGLLTLAGSAVVGSVLFAAVGQSVGFPGDTTKAGIRKWKADYLETTQKTLAAYDAMDKTKQKEVYEKSKAKADADIAKAKENVQNDEKKKADLRSSALAAAVAIPEPEKALQEAKKEEVDIAAKVVESLKGPVPPPPPITTAVVPPSEEVRPTDFYKSKPTDFSDSSRVSFGSKQVRKAGMKSRRRRPRRKSSTRRR